MSAVSMERLYQITEEVEKFWRLYRLGVFTFPEVVVEVNARRVEMGFYPLTEMQQRQLLLRGMM